MNGQYFPSVAARANWLYAQRVPCAGCGMYLYGDPDLEVGEETMVFTHPECVVRYENKNQNQQRLAPVFHIVPQQGEIPEVEQEEAAWAA